jgi:2-hydroxy-3-oxopropionate reductase
MVGGSEADVARGRPIFAVLGTTVVHVGPAGAGQVAKMCNQLLVASTQEAVAEALVLAAKAGADPAKVREVLLGGFAASRVLEVHGERMLSGDFAPGFRSALMHKDGRIVLGVADEVRAPIPAYRAVFERLQRLVDAGRGDLDPSGLVTLLEDEAGIRIRPEG